MSQKYTYDGNAAGNYDLFRKGERVAELITDEDTAIEITHAMNSAYDRPAELKTSDEWYKQVQTEDPERCLTIMDPDGWDRRNYQFSFFVEKITQAEFERRVGLSTCMQRIK